MAFYNLLVAIAQAEEGQEIVKSEQWGTTRLYSEGADFFHHLNFFGWGKLDLIYEVKGKHQDSIKAFTPNRFGRKIVAFLLTEVLQFWNREDVSILSLCGKVVTEKTNRPFELFKNIFENNLVVLTIDHTEETSKNGVYCFKASLSKRVWRKINLSYKHTLADLHNAIQDAFDFDNDHLYGLYISGDQRSGKPIYCEEAGDGGATTEETVIADLNLYEGTQMLYFFDFGDELKLNVELLRIDADAPLLLKPVIVESKGPSPEQYGEVW